MSHCVSVFVGSGISLQSLKKCVEQVIPCMLVDRSSEIGHVLFESNVDEVWVSLFDEHGLDDDCGIEFSRFHFEIDFTSNADIGKARKMAIELGEALRLQHSVEVVVVENLQTVIPI